MKVSLVGIELVCLGKIGEAENEFLLIGSGPKIEHVFTVLDDSYSLIIW